MAKVGLTGREQDFVHSAIFGGVALKTLMRCSTIRWLISHHLILCRASGVKMNYSIDCFGIPVTDWRNPAMAAPNNFFHNFQVDNILVN